MENNNNINNINNINKIEIIKNFVYKNIKYINVLPKIEEFESDYSSDEEIIDLENDIENDD
jgi:hypothetical protein